MDGGEDTTWALHSLHSLGLERATAGGCNSAWSCSSSTSSAAQSAWTGLAWPMIHDP